MHPTQDQAIVPAGNTGDLPSSIWRAIFQFLDPETGKAVSEASRELMHLWREGVLGLQFALPSTHPMVFLTETRFSTFPNLQFVEVAEEREFHPIGRLHQDDQWALSRPATTAGAFMHLSICSKESLQAASRVMESHPALANMVTRLAIGSDDFDFKGLKFSDIWTMVSQLPNLMDIDINTDLHLMSITDADLRQLLTLQSLRQLGLCGAKGFNGEGLDGLSGSSLQSLLLGNCPTLRGENLQKLALSPSLDALTLVGRLDGVSDDHLVVLGSHPSLKHIGLHSGYLSAGALSVIAQQTSQLESLTLFDGFSIDLEGLQALQQMPNLQYLTIDRRLRVNAEEVLAWLAKMPALTELSYWDDTPDAPMDLGTPLNAKNQPIKLSFLKNIR